MTDTIRIPSTISNRGEDGKSKRWCKLLASVDHDAMNGFGFRGGFVERGKLVNTDDVPNGSILLENAGNNGSAKYPCALLILWKRCGDAFEEIARAEGDEWAFELRDKAIKTLSKQKEAATNIDGSKLLAVRDCLAQALKIARTLSVPNSLFNEHIERALNLVQECV